MVADGFHLHRIGAGDAFIADFFAEQARDDDRREGRGVLGIERLELDVADHHRSNSGFDRRTKRDEVAIPQIIDRAANDGKLDMRINRGVAQAGEVLSAGGDAFALEAAYFRTDDTADRLWVCAGRA